MINLNIKINDRIQKIEIKEDILFNTMLYEHLDTIKLLIKNICPTYKIDKYQFKVINKFIDFDEKLISVYPGLIVQTKVNTYAVLYLEDADIDEEYMIDIIKNYIHDTYENTPKPINIDKFEIAKKDFLRIVKDRDE